MPLTFVSLQSPLDRNTHKQRKENLQSCSRQGPMLSAQQQLEAHSVQIYCRKGALLLPALHVLGRASTFPLFSHARKQWYSGPPKTV